ncbi:hypothetical protein STEG23_027423, partial [Scotinomys teguina]
IVRETPISGVRTFYTDANKQGKAGYKSEDLSKVVQSPYNSVQKSELYAILLVLMDFSEPLNIVTDSQYAERVVLHIETAEFIPDESELTSLFIQLQDIIRNRKHPLYITHIRSHTGLPGPLAQGNDEIDKLLIGNVLEASEFHKKHHVNSKGLKRDFSITWQQAKEIVRKCPTCSFYNQTPLPAGCNPKGTQRNDIWQMDVFHFAEFGKLKYVHHTIDTYSGFQWATALSSEKADSVITHLLEVMAIMGIPAQIKTDNAPAYVSGKMKQFFAYYNIKHITGMCETYVSYNLDVCTVLDTLLFCRIQMHYSVGMTVPLCGSLVILLRYGCATEHTVVQKLKMSRPTCLTVNPVEPVRKKETDAEAKCRCPLSLDELLPVCAIYLHRSLICCLTSPLIAQIFPAAEGTLSKEGFPWLLPAFCKTLIAFS